MKILLAGAMALGLAAPAMAESLTTTTAVRHADLDLSQAAAAHVMLERLDAAAARVCGASPFSLREVKAEVRRTSCYRDSLSQAVASLDAPAVTAAYKARTEVSLAAN